MILSLKEPRKNILELIAPLKSFSESKESENEYDSENKVNDEKSSKKTKTEEKV